jgi:Hemerythrin HHE cation binding domain
MTTTTTRTTDRTVEIEGMNKIIHAAFRRDLTRIHGALAELPAGSPARAARLSAAWDHFCYQLHTHHHDEEAFFWPAFTELGVDLAIVADLHGEHDVMVAALEAAEEAMAAFGADPSASNTAAAHQAVGWLRYVLGEHLAHEERDMDPFSDSHQSTRQFKAAQRSSRKAHTEGAGNFFAWLSDDCSPEVRRALHHEVPAPVLFLMTRLGGRRYTKTVASIWR